ncbi:hypothetical protein H4Q26_006300 [Puccinia striiformis f. sp. tritici PST-130]|nr:hypothetical protein H4Q26_006300 [Puccinia striiformis f. sp. tritici PST-130]
MSHSPSTSVAAPSSDASLMPSTDCVPRISDLDFARISRLLAPNSSQANPSNPTPSASPKLPLTTTSSSTYSASSAKPIPLVPSSIEVENDKKERDEEKALNEGTQR